MATARFVVALALVVGLLASTGVCDQQAKASGFPARQFNSELPLRVQIQERSDSAWKDVGSTPSEKPIEVPACHTWRVVPSSETPIRQIVKEMEAQRIPGVRSRQATDDDLKEMKELKGLQTLDVTKSSVTDAGLAHLKELNGLQSLDLTQTRVTDAGLAHLKELKSLQTLDLRRTPVTDAGVAHLKELKGLQTLSLLNTRVTDAGLPHLKELEGLQRLDLMSTRVTDAGVAELQRALPGCRISR